MKKHSQNNLLKETGIPTLKDFAQGVYSLRDHLSSQSDKNLHPDLFYGIDFKGLCFGIPPGEQPLGALDIRELIDLTDGPRLVAGPRLFSEIRVTYFKEVIRAVARLIESDMLTFEAVKSLFLVLASQDDISPTKSPVRFKIGEGNVIAQARKALGLSQESFAALLRIPKTTLVRYEKGLVKKTPEAVIRYCQQLIDKEAAGSLNMEKLNKEIESRLTKIKKKSILTKN